MRTLLLTLHVVAAIFVIGPLVAAANQAARALRESDLGALRTISRLVTIYGWASLSVLLFGIALVRKEWQAEFSDAWVLISLGLYAIAFVLVIGQLVPALGRAVTTAESGGSTEASVGRVAALGGVISLLYVAIAVLMVYKPGG
jgi:uncharacterized membrane protein